MSEVAYEAGYVRGIEHFNAREFFEAHDAWEEVWTRSRGPERLFYKGLIHAAVALHHCGNGNFRGARKMLGSCVRYLSPYGPQYLGLDVPAFLSQLHCCCTRLMAGSHAGVEVDVTQMPSIQLDPSTTRRDP